ncbi:MAG: hypothetical protein IIA45_06790, partial [Bacteroidetes bacterium]|nr:hypothetical protein [Bacteroidota bacterium]
MQYSCEENKNERVKHEVDPIALAHNDSAFSIYTKIVSGELTDSNYEDVYMYLDSAIKIDKTFTDSYLNKAFFLAQNERYDDALSILLKATKINKQFTEGYMQI